LPGEARRMYRAVDRRSSVELSVQLSEELLFPAVIVHARRSDRDAEGPGGLLDGQVVIEDQLEHFALPAREFSERLKKNRGGLGIAGRRGLHFFSRPLRRQKIAHESLAGTRGRRTPDHREEPRLQRRAPFESRLSFKNLQVHVLQNFLRFIAVAA